MKRQNFVIPTDLVEQFEKLVNRHDVESTHVPSSEQAAACYSCYGSEAAINSLLDDYEDVYDQWLNSNNERFAQRLSQGNPLWKNIYNALKSTIE